MQKQTYFLGSSSAKGFVPAADGIMGDPSNTVYILKGTAGSGKSTLMKKVSEAFSDSPQEIYRCSADPDSLDAVFIADKKAVVVDGTSPHCFDPKYPKAVENIVDLGAFLDTAALRSCREEIVSMTDEYSGYHKRCRLCLSAASSVMADLSSAASKALDLKKLSSFAERLLPRIIMGRKASGSGRITFRQLSAMTMHGVYTYVPEGMETVLINDEFGAASSVLLRRLAQALTAKGFDIIVSRCVLSEDSFYEHIIIPELQTVLLTSDIFTALDIPEADKIISMRRFYSREICSAQKSRLSFGRKALSGLMDEAAKELTGAKALHDRIEEKYIAAADFGKINAAAESIIADIKSL